MRVMKEFGLDVADERGVNVGSNPRSRKFAVRGRTDAENIPTGNEGLMRTEMR